MRRRLSSRLTMVWKVILPLGISGVLGLVTLGFFLSKSTTWGPSRPGVTPFPIAPIKWMLLSMWLVFTIMLSWIALALWRVFRDETTFYVANFLPGSDVAVPLAAVAKVREIKWGHINGKHPIVVELSPPQLCGKRFVFLPTGKPPFSWPWNPKPHAIAAELQAVAAHNATISSQESLPWEMNILR